MKIGKAKVIIAYVIRQTIRPSAPSQIEGQSARGVEVKNLHPTPNESNYRAMYLPAERCANGNPDIRFHVRTLLGQLPSRMKVANN